MLETLHLVEATEVHLADQCGAVAVCGHVAGPGHVLGEDHPMVVPRTAVVRFLGGEQTHARRRADRRGADGRIELNTAGSQRIKMLCLHDRMAGEAGDVGRVLIRQQEQHIERPGIRSHSSAISRAAVGRLAASRTE